MAEWELPANLLTTVADDSPARAWVSGLESWIAGSPLVEIELG